MLTQLQRKAEKECFFTCDSIDMKKYNSWQIKKPLQSENWIKILPICKLYLSLYTHFCLYEATIRKSCSENIWKIHRKIPVVETYFSKIAGWRHTLLVSFCSKKYHPFLSSFFRFYLSCQNDKTKVENMIEDHFSLEDIPKKVS